MEKNREQALYVALRKTFTQATRNQESVPLTFWDLRLPNGDWVSCKTIEEARECAAGFARGIYL